MKTTVAVITLLAMIIAGASALQCRECAHLVPDTGDDTYNTLISGIYEWEDDDCLDDPASFSLRTCEGSTHCVALVGSAELTATVFGSITISGSVDVVYRNCSELASPPEGCGSDSVVGEAVKDEIIFQTGQLMDLSEIDYDLGEVEAEACYCDEDDCNDVTDFEGEEPVVTTTPEPPLTCRACSWSHAGKKAQKKLKKLLPQKRDQKCVDKPGKVKKGKETCDEDEICAALQLDISAFVAKGKETRSPATVWIRGCVDEAVAGGGMGCFNLDEYKDAIGEDLTTALEDFVDLDVEGVSGAVCFCDEPNCNSHNSVELGTVADRNSKSCIESSCSEVSEGGTYHKCGTCSEYFVCKKKGKKSKRNLLKKCKRNKHWDNNPQVMKCVKKGTSSTCSED